MPEWMSQIMGPGGVLIAFIIFGKASFTFLSGLLARQEKRLDGMRTQVLKNMEASTVAITKSAGIIAQNTDTLKMLAEQINACSQFIKGSIKNKI